MGQRSSPQPYLRVMAQEIQWEGAQVTNNTALQDILSPEHAQWTALSDRSWSVVLHGRRFKVEVEKGPDAEGNATVRINGVRKDIRVLDERTQLLEKMGMSVAASAAVATCTRPCQGRCCRCLWSQALPWRRANLVGARSDEDGKRHQGDCGRHGV